VKTIRIGIDPGADGGLVALGDNRAVLSQINMPTDDVGVTRNRTDKATGKKKRVKGKKRVLDFHAIVSWLRSVTYSHDPVDVFAVLEHQQTFPGEGVSTSFNSGRGYGALEMALVALRIPYEVVRARSWQTQVLKGVEGNDTKARAVMKAKRAIPGLTWPGRKAQRSGIADAACMALHGFTLRPASVAVIRTTKPGPPPLPRL